MQVRFRMPYRVMVSQDRDDLVMATSFTLAYARVLMARMAEQLESSNILMVVDRQGNCVPPVSIQLATLPADSPF